jgi:hypothetical protein
MTPMLVVAAFLASLASVAAGQKDAAAPLFTDVFVAGDGGYHTYRIPSASIGVLVERGERSPYERITFTRFTLQWLTDGSDR